MYARVYLVYSLIFSNEYSNKCFKVRQCLVQAITGEKSMFGAPINVQKNCRLCNSFEHLLMLQTVIFFQLINVLLNILIIIIIVFAVFLTAPTMPNVLLHY